MTIHTAWDESVNGQQRISNGLAVHYGKFSVGPPGQGDAPYMSGDVNASRGNGTGVYYFGGTPGKYLFFDGTRFNLQGGQLYVPGGLAQGTATNLAGNRILQAWNIPAAGAWYETPLQQNLSVTAGNVVRIDCSGSLYHSVIPTVTYLGVMLDGAVALDSVQTTTCTLANATMPYGFTTYLGGQITTSGNHRFSLMLYANGGGAGGFWGGAYQCISVTEQRA